MHLSYRWRVSTNIGAGGESSDDEVGEGKRFEALLVGPERTSATSRAKKGKVAVTQRPKRSRSGERQTISEYAARHDEMNDIIEVSMIHVYV